MSTCRICLSSVSLLALLTLAGCAATHRNQPLHTVTPTDDEMAELPAAASRPQQAAVRVEGKFDEPQVVLVPEYKEPELTEEEKDILGVDDARYTPLLHDLNFRRVDDLVGLERGAIDAAVFGSGLSYRVEIGESINARQWGSALPAVGYSSAPSRVQLSPPADPFSSYFFRSDLATTISDAESIRVRTYDPRE